MMVEWIGGLAALLTMASFVPQVWKIVSTRETAGVSRRTYILTTAASVLWVSYGWAISSVSVILCNATLGLLALSILALKARYG